MQLPTHLWKANVFSGRDFRKAWSLASLFYSLLLVSFFVSPALGQDEKPTVEPPLIVRIEPGSSAPQTKIKVEGYRFRANLEEAGRVLFVQGPNEYEVDATGSGYEAANLKHGLQDLDVIVPDVLQPGACQVVVKVDGLRSLPFDFNINVPATAPILTKITPDTPRPTEWIWIMGSGFAASDEVQLIDANGRKHRFKDLGSCSAGAQALPLPRDLPGGEANLLVIEHRSGTKQQSNVLSFTIARGPTPIEIYAEWLKPVAPGQWLDLVGSDSPLKGAERLEISFRQNEQFLIVATRSVSDLRIQVPASLRTGPVTLENRTIVDGEASAWSSPIQYQLLESPAPAKVYGLEIRAIKTEVAFKQEGRIVAIVAVRASEYPRVRVPKEKLAQGSVEVLTRVWRGGKPSEWLFQHHGFDWPNPDLAADGTISEGPYLEQIPLGSETPKTLTVYPGEKLVLEGTFPVESPQDIRVTLQSGERLPLVLQASDGGNPHRAKIALPPTLGEGEWEVTVQNGSDGASMKLPVSLKVESGANANSHSLKVHE